MKKIILFTALVLGGLGLTTASAQPAVTTFSCDPAQTVRVDVVSAWEVELSCEGEVTPEPSATPTDSPTATATATVSPTNTPTVVPPTATAAPTETPLPTATATSVPPTPTEVPSGLSTWTSDLSGEWADPSSPLSVWNAPQLQDWAFVVHSRDSQGMLTDNDHDHGPNCEPPLATHNDTSYEGAIYICKNHIMTSVGESGYAMAYIIPPVVTVFDSGDTVNIDFRVSSNLSSSRDWMDVQLIPVDVFSTHSLDSRFAPDLNGVASSDTFFVTLDATGAPLVNNFFWNSCNGTSCQGTGVDSFWAAFDHLTMETRTRQRELMRLTISGGNVSFTAPETGNTWVSGGSMANANACADGCVVVFGHHSYNPTKDCQPGLECDAASWHWSGFSIDNAMPMRFNQSNQANVWTRSQTAQLNWDTPSTAGDSLHCGVLGTSTVFSWDGINFFSAPNSPAVSPDFSNFNWRGVSIPDVPAGTDRVYLRGTSGWGEISVESCVFTKAGS